VDDLNQMSSEERIVTIFGGSKCGESDLEYKQALQVGAFLADAGFTICTGGYAGVMEAASRGAHERWRTRHRRNHEPIQKRAESLSDT